MRQVHYRLLVPTLEEIHLRAASTGASNACLRVLDYDPSRSASGISAQVQRYSAAPAPFIEAADRQHAAAPYGAETAQVQLSSRSASLQGQAMPPAQALILRERASIEKWLRPLPTIQGSAPPCDPSRRQSTHAVSAQSPVRRKWACCSCSTGRPITSAPQFHTASGAGGVAMVGVTRPRGCRGTREVEIARHRRAWRCLAGACARRRPAVNWFKKLAPLQPAVARIQQRRVCPGRAPRRRRTTPECRRGR